ncbi:hypothetical protein PILCRDRAFT_2210 [Piloderma croceum F 1598]|uniref:Uncharacterized protein n=1 Tax=Piloderma croceum (strain F 1598) TaxID=765440 RepID=A0A0C3CJM9_PILCF|nr:hypothetical protein PILCRDRAFT_2210 [Piloderma croceum F 1598]
MAVISLCSNLRKLSISVVDRNTDSRSHPDAYTAKWFFDALETLYLPPHIEILSVELRIPTHENKWVFKGHPVKNSLARKYPTLRAIKFTGDITFTWIAPKELGAIGN